MGYSISRVGVGISSDCFSNEEGLLDLVSKEF